MSPQFSSSCFSLVRSYRWPFLIICAHVALHGQSASDRDEPQVLSPFVVSAESDTGYVGSQSTLGSRLKQEAKDIASQVEIMTPEFLQDFGVNDVQDAFRYSINVENPDEYLAPGGDSSFFSGRTSGRIRGISTSAFSTSQNLFSSITTADSYNFNRIEVASGAQSMLFGIGQPAGQANITLNNAEMRNFGELSIKVDSEESYRSVLDYNRELVAKTLAVRVSILKENTQKFIKPSSDEDTRFYGAVTFRPFRNTTIRIHGETVEEVVNPGITHLPWDFATPFYTAQQNGTLDSLEVATFGATSNSPYLLFGATEAPLSLFHWRSLQIPVSPGQLPYDVDRFGSAFDPNSGVARITFNPDNIGMVPEAAASLGTNIFGDNVSNRINASIINLFFEQRLRDNLIFEAGMHSERWKKRLHMVSNYNQYGYYADINEYVPTVAFGSNQQPNANTANFVANPNYGKVFSRSVPTGDLDLADTEEYRASLVWQPKLSDIKPWLGEHTLLASISHRESSQRSQSAQPKLVNPTLAYQNFSGPLNNARRLIVFQSYFDQNQLTVDRPFPEMSLDDYFYGWELTDPASGEVIEVSGWGSESGGNRPSGDKTELDTMILSWQGNLLKDRLLLNYGFRRDDVSNTVIDREAAGVNRLENGGWEWIDNIGFDPATEVQETADSHTYGVIARPLSWLSLSYYESSTFNLPTGSQTPFGEPVPGASGDSRDYGVRFDFNKGRTYLKINRYETNQHGNNVGFGAVRIDTIALEKSYRDALDARALVDGTPSYSEVLEAQGISRGVNGDTSLNDGTYPILGDTIAEGVEVSAGTRWGNWDFRLNFAKATSVDANVSGSWNDWIDARVPYWEDVADENGNVGWENVTYRGPNAEDYNVSENGVTRTMTMAEYYQNVVVGSIAVAKQRNDTPVDTSRKYRANLNVAYGFKSGMLRGVRAGGALRYRSSAIIGFPVIELANPNGGLPLPGLDLQNPYRDDALLNMDLFVSFKGKSFLGSNMGYRVQLNARDVFTGENSYRTGKVNGHGESTFTLIETPRAFSAELTLLF